MVLAIGQVPFAYADGGLKREPKPPPLPSFACPGELLASQPIGGILSAPKGGVAIHLRGLPGTLGGPPVPVRPCSGWGLPSRPGHPGRWCALTAPFHPCLCPEGPSAVCSLWHFPAGHPDWPLASTLALWSPDLPRPGQTGPRPPGRLAASIVPRTGTIPHKRGPSCQSSTRWEQRSEAKRPSGGD